MKNPASPTITLPLEHFPIYRPGSEKPGTVDNIVRYLELLAQGNLSDKCHYIELPSIGVLSGFFQCSYLEIYDAFRALRNRGYDYQFSSMDGAMLIWREPKNAIGKTAQKFVKKEKT